MNPLAEPVAPLAPAPASPAPAGLDLSRIRAITLDLDDTLWPVWPAIARAETVLQDWLRLNAPDTASLCAQPGAVRAFRERVGREMPHLAHDLAALRQEAIRRALEQAGDDPALAAPAFEVFFAQRQRVDLYPDAEPALAFLSARWPVVALSNGNADVARVGIGHYFRGAVSMRAMGIGKPHAPIFREAARVAGVAPHEVLHIGDDPHLDAVGGLGTGMQVAWVNRGGHDWAHTPHVPHVTVPDLHSLGRLLAAA